MIRITRQKSNKFFPFIIILLPAVIWLTAGRADCAGQGTVIKVAAVGDIMMGTEGRLPADGGASLFSQAQEYLKSAQVVFGNHEGTLTDRGAPTKVTGSGRSYCFRTPPSYGRFLKKAGFTMISLANNHINDYGPQGKQQTVLAMEQNGLAWSDHEGQLAVRTFNDRKVVMAAFYSSGVKHNVNDIPGARRLVEKLAQKYDIVVISFHGGAEGQKAVHIPSGGETFYGENRGDVIKFSRAMVDAGADLILGHGPHVPRAMEVYKGRLIAYSLGNFCTGKGINVKGATGLAPLLLADLDGQGRLLGGRIVSFYQTYGEHPRLDPKNRAASLIHKLGRDDFPNSNAVAADGSLIVR